VGENIIVILSTHIVEDVSNLCHKMAVMNLGRVLFNGKTTEALDMLNGRIFETMIDKEALPEFREKHNIISTRVSEGKILIHVLGESSPGAAFKAIDGDLEDVYFSYINSK